MYQHDEPASNLDPRAPDPAAPEGIYEPALSELEFSAPELKLLGSARSDSLMQELTAKSKIIGEIRNAISSTTLATTPYELRHCLHQIWARAYGEMSADHPESVKLYEELKDLRRQKRDYNSVEVAPRPDFDPLSIGDRISEILRDKGAAFLEGIDYAMRGLLRKNDYVRRVNDNPSVLYRDLSEIASVRKRAVIDYELRPFAVDVRVDSSKLVKWRSSEISSEGTLGEHWDGSEFNLSYLPGDAQSAEVFQHEQVHNLLDGVRAFRRPFPAEYLKRELNRLEDGLADGDKEEVRERLFRLTARRIVDLCHEEILAEFKLAESRLGRLPEHWLALEFEGSEHATVSYRGKMSTAGSDIRRAGGAIRSAARRIEDAGVSEYCEELADELTVAFEDSIELLRRASFIARGLAEGALESVESLAILLKPGQWRHIFAHLHKRYDPGVCRERERLFESLNRGCLTFATITRLEQALDEGEIGELDLGRVGDRVKQTYLYLAQPGAANPELLAALGIDSAQTGIAYQGRLRGLAERAGCSEVAEQACELVETKQESIRSGSEMLSFYQRLGLHIERTKARIARAFGF